ncbi:hypothetical protein ACPSLY_07000 [Vibrio parahaemolyticus]|uniref:hypothetical protein n=1 Tax=Vibrio TaxID=662 RepID=UPI0003A055BB|nr:MULTISPECIES: hypothetical protein [Vibrio]AYO04206.1 hypothetical protein D0871_07870 [Vibrio parahaemolyticus]EGQ8922608.1 hypothetical protein [Vibrio parahaemolyticus]EGQ9444909.1 hypothetical protein [Vibrio parahaemolyticus]EGR3370935.1 hypothetical protein [Vibrio parahaemolyticus]EHZ2907570.1 hypothetical protein [Vibrio parahaemolyticus]
MNNLEKLLGQNTERSLVKGEWFNIRWTPDIATGEKLNIGVGFVENGRVHSRLLSYFERVKCLYGERGIYHAELVTSIVGESLRQNKKSSPIPQITYDNSGYAQGFSVDEVLSSLFEQTVPLQKKIRVSSNAKRFNSVNTDKLYTCLVDELKIKAALQFEEFVPADSSIFIEDNLGSHELFVPFRDNKNLVGGLASTVYSNVQRIELNLLKAARDVESAVKLGKGNKASVFILMPGDEVEKLDKEQVISIENTLDKFDWHMNKQGISVGGHTSVSGLADEICSWANVA